MSLNVCPFDTVLAPTERVWKLLMRPAGYGQFWDLTVELVEPEGPAVVGQTFIGSTRALCRRWRIVGQVQEVDSQRHHLLFRLTLPSGIISTNRLMCARIDHHSCTLRYG